MVGLLLVAHRLLAWVGVLAALLIAATRLYLGVHWPHDTLAGLALGVVVSLAAWLWCAWCSPGSPPACTAPRSARCGQRTRPDQHPGGPPAQVSGKPPRLSVERSGPTWRDTAGASARAGREPTMWPSTRHGEAFSIYRCGNDEGLNALHTLGRRGLRLSCLGPRG